MTAAARARIRLGAIRKNFESIRSLADGAKVMAVVKANAYGHGLVAVSKVLADADSLAVARLVEARVLREAGVDTPITLLGGAFLAEDIPLALQMELQLCVHCDEQIAWLENTVAGSTDVWLKIDTGMNRLGFRPANLPEVLDRLAACTTVGKIRLMTHLANADNTEDDTTSKQLATFARAVDGFNGDISIANSAGIFGWPEISDVLADAYAEGRLWVRPGLSLYGIAPLLNQPANDFGLRPAMQFESQLIAVHPLSAGERVGYGGAWQCEADTIVGVVSVGYGDGYPRSISSGAEVHVNGRRVSVIGRVSMDLVTVDLGAGARDQFGDVVVLWGDELPVEEMAHSASTIAYTLVTGVADRVERIYED